MYIERSDITFLEILYSFSVENLTATDLPCLRIGGTAVSLILREQTNPVLLMLNMGRLMSGGSTQYGSTPLPPPHHHHHERSSSVFSCIVHIFLQVGLLIGVEK